MSKIKHLIQDKLFFLRTGINVKTANGGEPIDVVTIRYKDLYFFVDIDAESGEPTGGFGWAEDPTMNPTVPIRDIWIATPGESLEEKHE